MYALPWTLIEPPPTAAAAAAAAATRTTEASHDQGANSTSDGGTAGGVTPQRLRHNKQETSTFSKWREKLYLVFLSLLAPVARKLRHALYTM